MLHIEINREQILKNTEELFNINYMNLFFSDNDTAELCLKKDSELNSRYLIYEKIVSSISVYDTLKSRAKGNRFEESSVVKRMIIDSEYLEILGNSGEFELKDITEDKDTYITYQLSWKNKDKFTKVNLPKRERIY